ncbi:MAG: prolyl oligopeptidase family serine peptidase [Planctomycetota bacterium]|nr:prolyl oligopeptidase family serine peptidase [Planctomycetota bacterium]
MRKSMIGAYGLWAADTVLGKGPARLSFRTGKWRTLDAWRRVARKRVLECIAPVDLGGTPKVRVESSGVCDGLYIERLSWQLPMGRRTEAVFLKPADAQGRLPGILGRHDHSGKKYLGWRKIARDGGSAWQVQEKHQKKCYGGVAWANEVARRGYAVLVHDTFPFASRRVRVADVLPQVQYGGVDPEPGDLAGFNAYNEFAGLHEHIMAKSLFCAGTTWPGVYLAEDQKALDVLCARPDVDARRVGCGGLSGGGMRTTYLAGLDDRITCAVCVGFMTTWREFLLDKCYTHTWMIYAPLLPKDLDFPEIIALRAPLATMVQNDIDDMLFTIGEMRRADRMIRDTYRRGGAVGQYKSLYYPGPHKFDLAMQADAFDWFDEHLK